MDDQDIPGLMDYIGHPSVVDSPVNRKAYRIVYAMCREFGKTMNVNFLMVPMWSQVHSRVVAYACIELDGGLVPIMMVHQTELQTLFDLRCSPDCGDGPGETGCECELFKETEPNAAQPDPAKFKEVNDAFAHIVQGWDSPLPDINELSKLYDTPTEGEDGAQGNP